MRWLSFLPCCPWRCWGPLWNLALGSWISFRYSILLMSSVSETIVREYFELHEFLVRQTRKHIRQTRSAEDDDIDFFVLNPHPQTGSVLPFILASTELPVIQRA